MEKKVKLPYKFTPRQYQMDLLKAWDNGIKRLVWVAHRRSGKDKTVFAQLPKKMFERVGLYFYVLPTYTQGNKVIWKGADKDGFRFIEHIPKEIIKGEPNETEMRVELVNGSILQIIGADNIDRIVGTNPIGVVFSEFSLMKPNVWDFIRPILAENGGWAVFIYTPRGKNHAWKLHQQAKENPNWFEQTLTVEDTGAISKEALEEDRKTMPQALFEQEYYCKYIEGASQFFKRVRENLWDGNLESEYGKDYKLGCDLAKYNDWTVLTAIDLHSFRVGRQERFNQIDYNLQKAKIEAFQRRYNSGRMTMDSTGVGEPIYDDLSARGLNVEPFKFTENSRNDLLRNLAIMIEQDRIKLPNDEILLGELEAFQYELTERGKTKVVVPDGMHDDCVMSLALAVWDVREKREAPTKHREDDSALYPTDYD